MSWNPTAITILSEWVVGLVLADQLLEYIIHCGQISMPYILDEVFDSSLDSSGTEEFLELIHSLGDSTNCFIISHKSDQLLDKFDRVIKFAKVKNFSTMEYL